MANLVRIWNPYSDSSLGWLPKFNGDFPVQRYGCDKIFAKILDLFFLEIRAKLWKNAPSCNIENARKIPGSGSTNGRFLKFCRYNSGKNCFPQTGDSDSNRLHTVGVHVRWNGGRHWAYRPCAPPPQCAALFPPWSRTSTDSTDSPWTPAAHVSLGIPAVAVSCHQTSCHVNRNSGYRYVHAPR